MTHIILQAEVYVKLTDGRCTNGIILRKDDNYAYMWMSFSDKIARAVLKYAPHIDSDIIYGVFANQRGYDEGSSHTIYKIPLFMIESVTVEKPECEFFTEHYFRENECEYVIEQMQWNEMTVFEKSERGRALKEKRFLKIDADELEYQTSEDAMNIEYMDSESSSEDASEE
jgi:hypothetical protein